MEQWGPISDLTSQERWGYICTENYLYFDVDLRLPWFFPDLDFVKKLLFIHTYIHIHPCTSSYVHTYVRTYLSTVHTYVNTYSICAYLHMYVHIYILHTQICSYLHTYILHTYLCMYVGSTCHNEYVHRVWRTICGVFLKKGPLCW